MKVDFPNPDSPTIIILNCSYKVLKEIENKKYSF